MITSMLWASVIHNFKPKYVQVIDKIYCKTNCRHPMPSILSYVDWAPELIGSMDSFHEKCLMFVTIGSLQHFVYMSLAGWKKPTDRGICEGLPLGIWEENHLLHCLRVPTGVPEGIIPEVCASMLQAGANSYIQFCHGVNVKC